MVLSIARYCLRQKVTFITERYDECNISAVIELIFLVGPVGAFTQKVTVLRYKWQMELQRRRFG